MKFSLRLHHERKGVQVIEVTDDNGDLLATITPGDTSREMRILSKHLLSPETQVHITPSSDGVMPGIVELFL